MYQSTTHPPPLHQWDITDASLLPLPQEKRKITDVCCAIIGVIFGLTLFILAIVLMNQSNLTKTLYPSDSKGVVCLQDAVDSNNTKYPFLYFNDISNPNSNRHCVQECPQQGVPTRCYDSCTIIYYPNYPSNDRFGALCLPNDKNTKQNLLYNAGVFQQFNAVKAIDYLLIGMGIAFGLSIIWMILVQFLPKIAVWLAYILAAILFLITGIVFFVASGSHLADSKGWAIFLGIICIILMLLVIYYILIHRKQIQICVAFIKIATNCLKANLTSILYILLFIALTIAFIVLIVFQYLAFSSSSAPAQKGLYYQTAKNGFLTFLLVVQTIWGLSFFRDAFNYINSGVAVQWYFSGLSMCCWPFKRFFCKNFGSVVGGSLLRGLFYFPSLIISFLSPDIDCCCCNIFDLGRSDAYAYIYLTGNSYCPSSRQAQYLCNRSRICRQNESVIEIYAFCARVLISLASVLIVYWIARDNLVNQVVPGYLLLGIFGICLYITCYFVDIHTVMAEAILVCFLAQFDLQETYKQMRSCPQQLKKIITDIDHEPINQRAFN